MDTNDNGDKVIDMNCFCKLNKKTHCEGNLYIQPDHMDGERVFCFGMTDTKGNDQANMWLNYDQMIQLSKELKILAKEYK